MVLVQGGLSDVSTQYGDFKRRAELMKEYHCIK